MITDEIAKKQLDTLHQEGYVLAQALADEGEGAQKDGGAEGGKEQARGGELFGVGYQRWYSRALPLMKQLAPDRYAEFQRCYNRDTKAGLHWSHDKVIQDYIFEYDKNSPVITRGQAHRSFTVQLAILKSVADRLTWMALDTEDQMSRSLQLSLLETARGLIKVNERAAGVMAGCVLDAYLKKLAARHQVRSRKQSPPLGELAEALKAAKVLDIPAWSQVTWIADLRERCWKAEGEAPTKLQVRDLIDGTHWLITNVF
ncbi:MAG TPA: hypothetical protein VGH91_05575 [Gammaproteobacteria bacterium]|jgi:hypothetical protein